jgi:hypothetical protein
MNQPQEKFRQSIRRKTPWRRNLLAENREKAANKRTVAAISERNPVGHQCSK